MNPETSNPAPRVASEGWQEIARQAYRDIEYYRNLLDECAKHLGPGVYISDEGSVQDEPLRAKVPSLVAELRGILSASEAARKAAEDGFEAQLACTDEMGKMLNESEDARKTAEATSERRRTWLERMYPFCAEAMTRTEREAVTAEIGKKEE